MPHRALHIVEMLIRICQNANDATLAVLARTSRSFHDPAVQTLWSELVDSLATYQVFSGERVDHGEQYACMY